MKTEAILARVNAALNQQPGEELRQTLEALAADLAAQIRTECAKSKGCASELRTANAYLKRIRKDTARTALHYAWIDDKDRQCICDGCTAYRFRQHLPLEPRPENAGDPVNLDLLFPDAIKSCTAELILPTAAELRAHIKTDRALNGAKHTPLWDFGPGRPLVNAAYLLEMMQLIPDAKIYCAPGANGLIKPLYAAGENADAIILPCRPDNAERNRIAEALAAEQTTRRRSRLDAYMAKAAADPAYALSLDEFAELVAA